MLNNAKHTNFIHSIFESLEERVLFDGVPDATFVLPQADVATPIPEQVQSLEQIDSQAPRELILIDAGVENSEQLLQEILESKPNSAIEIRMIDSNSDGIEQISAILAESDSKYDAIHIISHGSEGEVVLGNTSLSADNLNQYADELAGWADALGEDADLLFYGCDLAGNEGGTEFIETISDITGADVAASDDLTGAADKGGDWDLEVNVGTVETAALSATAFDGILADLDGDNIDDADDLDDDNDGILDTDEGYIARTTTPLTASLLNSPGFPANTELQDPGTPVPGTTTSEETGDGTTARLNGLFGGVLDFEATLIENNTGSTITWANGVQIQNDLTAGDFIFVQPSNTNEFTDDSAQYTFNFNSPIENFSFITGGINDGDTAFYTAFHQGVAVPITAANFSNLDPGVTIVNENGLTNINTNGGTSVNSNRGTLTIDGPIDQLIINTGKNNNSASTNTLGFTTFTGDVITTPAIFVDTDGDGIGDHRDLDSDNDGISDLVESGADASVVDTDGDGVYDNTTAPGAAVDSNGVANAAGGGVSPVDSDSDNINDYLDLDSDGDGIPDAVEAQPTAGYTSPEIGTDADGDGIVDTFDSTTGHGGDFTTPVDTDGDDAPDYLDDDSDDDGIADSVESGLTLSGNDADGDGIDDDVIASYADPDGMVSDPINDLDNSDAGTTDVDFRSLDVSDKDGDGVADIDDLDADGDGILDSVESFGLAGTSSVNLLQFGGFEGLSGLFDGNNFSGTTSGAVDISPWVLGTGAEANIVQVDGADGFDYGANGPESDAQSGTGDGELQYYLDIVDGGNDFFQTFTITETAQVDFSGAFSRRNDTAPEDARIRIHEGVGLGGPEVASTNTETITSNTTWLQLDGTAVLPPGTYSFAVTMGNGLNFDNAIVTVVTADTDSDGVNNHCDIDSDNDGISDLIESGNAVAIAADTDGSGVIDNEEAADAGFTDADGDGAWDQLGATPVDTDMDGIADYLDLDSDNDGIADAVEAQPTVGYQSPAIGSDADGDGVVDTFDDRAVEHGGAFTAPVDTDNDGVFDFRDTDSDNDGTSDTIESGLPTLGADNNGDGIADNIAPLSYADTDGIISDPINDLENATDNDTTDVDYRSLNDKDWDGVADIFDADQDGDGILDEVELGFQQVAIDLAVGNLAFTPAGNIGNIGDEAIYSNVATVDGVPIDLRITVTGNSDPANLIVNIAGFTSGTDLFPIHLEGTTNTGTADIDFEFFESGTTTPVEVASRFLWQDIDVGESVSVATADLISFQRSADTFIQAQQGVNTTFSSTGSSGGLTNEALWVSTEFQLSDSLSFQFGKRAGNTGYVFGSETFTNGGADTNVNPVIGQDTDGDGIADHCDLDSDNDGISDLVESGNAMAIAADTDGNGVISTTEAAAANFTDSNEDGAWDQLGTAPPVDTDNDGAADYLDLDSDDDGIPDTIEAFSTIGYNTNDGDVTDDDTDGDGVLDVFDTTLGHGGDFTIPEDTDGDNTPDFLDDDSDNDGVDDINESGLMLSGDDDDGDGIDDAVGASYADPDGIVNDPSAGLDNEIGDTTEVGFREVAATVTIAGPGSVVEGQATTNYTVSLDQTVPTGNSVEVALSYTGVAADGTDFTGVTTVTIPAGATSNTFTIGSIDDPLAEGAEAFTVTIDSVTDTDDSFEAIAIDTANNSVETTINDEATPGPEDRANVSISGPATVVEGATVTYTVNVDSAPATDLEVDVVTGSVTTDAGDLTPVTTTVTILAGQTSTTFDVDTTDDILTEGNESFTASITGTNGGGFEAVVVDDANDSVETTILDNEDVPQFTINDVVVDEAVGSATFTVTLSTPSTQTVTVDYETTDGTAIQGADYTANTGTLTFDPGETTQTITVGILDDAIDEIAETYNVLLSDPTNAVITDGMGLGTINDQTGVDATPGPEDTANILISGPATVVEGEAATYTVNVDIAPVAALNIDVVTGFVTTDAGDLTPVTTTVTILAGQTSTTFGVDTIDDSIMDDGETFIASITGATGGGFENVAVDPANDSVETIINEQAVPPVLGSIGNLVFEDLNNNGIRDAGDPGEPGVTIELLDGTGNPILNGPGNPITTVTDANGFYEFTDLPAGEYRVRSSLPSGHFFTEQDAGANDIVDSDVDSTGLSSVVTLGEGEDNPTVDVGIAHFASVGGTVFFDDNGDGVQDAGETGVANVVVNLLDGGGSPVLNGAGVAVSTTTDANGNYTFLELQPGDFQVQFAAPTGTDFTFQNVGNDALDSDVDPTTGLSQVVTLGSEENNTTVAAGLSNNVADLVTVKTLASANATPAEGDTVTFQIEVSNHGSAQATNVSLTDSLPAGITLTGNATSQGTYDAATGLWTIGTLNNGDTATITLSGTVDVGQGGNTITNVTTPATGDQPDTSTADDDLDESVAVEVPSQLGAISGTVFQDGNNDGIQDAGEVGIAAVSVTLTGTDVFGNSVDITVLSDAAGNYSFDNLNAGDYTVTQAQPLGFEDGIDNGAANTVVGNDQISNITLGAGQSITGNTFAEQPIGGGTAGFPPNLPSFATFTNLSINDRLGSNQAPGPIYAGIPINANANPLTLESGRPVAGGYNADFGSSDAGSPVEVELECGDVVPVDPCNSCGLPIPVEQYPAQQIMVDECGCGPVMSSEQFQSGEVISEGQLMETPIERLDVPNAESIGVPLGLQKPSFLKRFSGWLSNADRG